MVIFGYIILISPKELYGVNCLEVVPYKINDNETSFFQSVDENDDDMESLHNNSLKE